MVLKSVGAGILALTTALAAAGCGDGTASDDGAPVIATTTIWADIASEVACGAVIPSLIPPGADPHTFEPSLRDRETLDRSSTVIANGLGLEAAVQPLLDTTDATVIEMTDLVDVIVDDGHDDDHDGNDGHDHEGGDPHIWQDPRRVIRTLDAIAAALHAADLDTCVDDYRAELTTLDGEIEALLADLPSDARVLVTSHDSLEYFAERYDFEIVGTVIPSTSTLAETNAADLATLADAIEAQNVPAIFTDAFESTSDADALARRLDVRVVPLLTGALTDDPATDTYVGMMRHNATLIAEALTP